MSEWISVNERLPNMAVDFDVSDNVLICFKRKCDKCYCTQDTDDYISVGFYSESNEDEDEKGWSLTEPLDNDYFPLDHENLIEVTHWMELPPKPEK